MKNIQIIDGAENATYSIFQATDEAFESIFPQPGQDIEVVEDYVARVGESEASQTLSKLWERPIHKTKIVGLHGTLFYDYKERAKYLPTTRRELDRSPDQINQSERRLYAKMKTENA